MKTYITNNEDALDDVEHESHEELDAHPQTEDLPPGTPKRAPGRPRIERTGLKGRPRKLFQTVEADARVTEEEFVFLAEIPVKQAVSSPDSEEWYDAMATELKSIIKNETWEIVERPKGTEIIGSRLVLRNKYRPDGTIERRKA